MSFNTSPLGPQDQPFLTMRQLVFEATDKRQLWFSSIHVWFEKYQITTW